MDFTWPAAIEGLAIENCGALKRSVLIDQASVLAPNLRTT